jgi:hypothetical protein
MGNNNLKRTSPRGKSHTIILKGTSPRGNSYTVHYKKIKIKNKSQRQAPYSSLPQGKPHTGKLA